MFSIFGIIDKSGIFDFFGNLGISGRRYRNCRRYHKNRRCLNCRRYRKIAISIILSNSQILDMHGRECVCISQRAPSLSDLTLFTLFMLLVILFPVSQSEDLEKMTGIMSSVLTTFETNDINRVNRVETHTDSQVTVQFLPLTQKV